MRTPPKMSICRLCLTAITDEDFKKINPNYRVMIKLVAAELNLDISVDPSICQNCILNLQEHYDFKVHSLLMQEQFKTNSSKEPAKKGRKRKTNGEIKKDDSESKCRTCYEVIENDAFFYLIDNKRIHNMAQLCLAELDLELVANPVICDVCAEALEKMFEFKNELLENEDRIEIFRDKCPRRKLIDLKHVIKTQDDVSEKNVKGRKDYFCSECSYQTRKEYELFQHYLTHAKVNSLESKSNSKVIKHVIKHRKNLRLK